MAGPVLANGGSDNSEREYAVRGAITNALGGAASKLGWQLSVYQDKRGHAGKATAKPSAKPAPAPQPAQPPANGGNGHGAQPPAAQPATPAPASAKPNGGNGNGAQPAAQPAAPDPLAEARALVLPAGKHKGETLGEVYQTDPEYVGWLAENAKTPAIQQAAAALLPAQSAPAPAPQPDPQPAPAPAPQPAAPAPAPAPSAPPVKPAPAMTLEAARGTVLPFAPRGKEQFKGRPLGEVYQSDPDFVRWLAANAVSASIKTAAALVAAATAATAQTA